MPCLINDTASPDFVRQRYVLAKDYPRIVTDLAALYEDIRKDHAKVLQSHSVPGFKNAVWKYRCDSSDMNRGKSGSFRVMAYYREADNTLYPFCVYSKQQYEQPPAKDVAKWIKNVKVAFSIGSVLVTEVEVEFCIVCGTSLSSDEKGAFGDRCAVHRTAVSN